jgi:hypothetical protein
MDGNLSYLIARFISALGSWLDASNLRNRVYKLHNENEILRVALDDIQRMEPNSRASKIVDKTKVQLRKL